jgi:MoaA/NifB/PqqE/SkfB family radical SAM enzyme
MNIEIKLTNREIRQLKHFHAIRPYRIKIQLTNACNARCAHCNLYKLPPRTLHTSIAKELLTSAKEMGCEEIDFTGGEPTLHPDFLDLFKIAKKLELKVKINTNGYVINEILAKEIYRLGIRE